MKGLIVVEETTFKSDRKEVHTMKCWYFCLEGMDGTAMLFEEIRQYSKNTCHMKFEIENL